MIQLTMSGVLDTGGVVASGTEVDNCGSSYLRMYGTVGRYLLTTGFTVKRGAISYHWGVDTYGPTGQHHSWGGGLKNKANWDGSVEAGVDRGQYSGLVTSGWALLNNGEICGASAATSSAYVS